ncbi:MAG TPA: hypothetical protein VMF09_03435 [Solirubrobacteraceae bacterium]|nr:hypothetical protein [Solirubrobacteraceae bacterium]
MSWLRVVAGRLTYANVVATLALFIALGGASYASLALPPASVGRAQLKPGAVTPAALSFPLAVHLFSQSAPVAFQRGRCNGGEPVPPGQPLPPCIRRKVDGPALGSFTLNKGGDVLVSGVVDVRDEATSSTSATVQLGVLTEPEKEGHHLLGEESVLLDGGQEEQVPLQALTTLPAGRHTIGLGSYVQYHGGTAGSGEVTIAQASLIATALPATTR